MSRLNTRCVGLLTAVAAAGLLLLAPDAWAQFPYEGTIELDGVPVSGDLRMRFEVYDSNDTLVLTDIWDEDICGRVEVVDGHFTVPLGLCAGVPGEALDAYTMSLQMSVWDDDGRSWVEIGDPRPLSMVPYAQWNIGIRDLVAGNLTINGTGTTNIPTFDLSGQLTAGRLSTNGSLDVGGTLNVIPSEAGDIGAANNIVISASNAACYAQTFNIVGEITGADQTFTVEGSDRLGINIGGDYTQTQVTGLLEVTENNNPGMTTTIAGGLQLDGEVTIGPSTIRVDDPLMRLQFVDLSTAETAAIPDSLTTEWFCGIVGYRFQNATVDDGGASEQELFHAYTYDNGGSWAVRASFDVTAPGSMDRQVAVLCVQAGAIEQQSGSWFGAP